MNLGNLLAEEVVNAVSTSKLEERDKLTDNRPIDTRGTGRDVPTDLPWQQSSSLGRKGQMGGKGRWAREGSYPSAVSPDITWGQLNQSPLLRHFLLLSHI